MALAGVVTATMAADSGTTARHIRGGARDAHLPLLTRERGHYELAAGGNAGPFLRALEDFAQGGGLIPEQIWDATDIPSRHLYLGRPTDAVIPLLWTHSEYVKLHRTATDLKVFDLVEAVYDRYVAGIGDRKPTKSRSSIGRFVEYRPGALLRIQADAPFLLHWTNDEWADFTDTASQATAIGVHFSPTPCHCSIPLTAPALRIAPGPNALRKYSFQR
jgi:glucoamylase